MDPSSVATLDKAVVLGISRTQNKVKLPAIAGLRRVDAPGRNADNAPNA